LKYDFTSGKREFGRVALTLTLDKKHLTERIIIGRTDEAIRRLEGHKSDVYYDEIHTLGNLLFHFKGDIIGEWNQNEMILHESYSKLNPFETSRLKTVKPVSDFLQQKYESQEPLSMFTAIRTWEDYLNCYNMNHGADLLSDKLSALYKPNNLIGDSKAWHEETVNNFVNALKSNDASVELWYPVSKRPLETVVTISSFIPLILYYINKINEWGLVFRSCKLCGNDFLAKSRYFEICSDKCRKGQATIAKREFDKRNKGDRLEQLYEASYFYWYNRLRKMKKTANPGKIATFKDAFDDFREEAIKRKLAVKSREIKLDEFAGWLVEKQNEADGLMG